ncbi:MAG: helix-turn-helix domain-containing protein [Thalassovita sp.]
MQNAITSNAWLPRHSWSAQGNAIVDHAYHDFDAQAERLTSHGQEYLQLTEGKFYGRFISCALGQQTSVHIEHANQALSQSIAGAPDTYAIGIVLSAGHVFRVNGTPIDHNAVFIIPPNVDFHLYSPQDATILACIVEKSHFEAKLAAAPFVSDRIAGHADITCLHAPTTADRLRQDTFNALRSCQAEIHSGFNPSLLGEALVNSMIATLMLEWHGELRHLDRHTSKTFDRFLNVKTHLETIDAESTRPADLSQSLALSKRSVQYAFANEVSLGVSGYHRHLRLHAIRRALRNEADSHLTIGDIASQYGFWNWSHFSRQYAQLFGERPSDTGPVATE